MTQKPYFVANFVDDVFRYAQKIAPCNRWGRIWARTKCRVFGSKRSRTHLCNHLMAHLFLNRRPTALPQLVYTLRCIDCTHYSGISPSTRGSRPRRRKDFHRGATQAPTSGECEKFQYLAFGDWTGRVTGMHFTESEFRGNQWCPRAMCSRVSLSLREASYRGLYCPYWGERVSRSSVRVFQ